MPPYCGDWNSILKNYLYRLVHSSLGNHMGHWWRYDATLDGFSVPYPCMPIFTPCLRQFHPHRGSISPSQLCYQEADALYPFPRVALAESRRKSGWFILHAEEERAKCCLFLRLGRKPVWDRASLVICTPQIRSFLCSRCEQLMFISYHPTRHFIASTIAGKWLLRSHTAFSWSANHFVKAFYCPLTP